MPQIRRRYYIWLLKAYFKKWKKTILISSIVGVVCFFIVATLLNFYVRPHLEKKVQKVGYWGMYRVENLPEDLLFDMSYGLTRIDDKNVIRPGAAESWEIQDDGKTFIFKLKDGLKFHNGKKLTADTVDLNFKDAKRERVDGRTIKYSLKEPYAPFLVSATKPLFTENSGGLGDYKLDKIDLNGGYVRSVSLQNIDDGRVRKNIYFYPTQEALKLAFIMGEVDQIQKIDAPQFLHSEFRNWKNIDVAKQTDYGNMVTLFYNNADPILSDKKVRQALQYSLPQEFSEGEKSYSPILPTSKYYYTESVSQPAGQDLARTILESPDLTIDRDLVISTTPEFEEVAKKVQASWEKVGIKSKIQIVPGVPSNFEILLYKFKVPHDPDQYTLWHSTGSNNITKYKNLRIDKLLEDGRSTIDEEERVGIYFDFQKYLLDDVPASFLYFPNVYTIKRK